MNHEIYKIDGQTVVRSDEGLVVRADGTTREQIDLEDEIEILENAISQNKSIAESLEFLNDPKAITRFVIKLIIALILTDIGIGLIYATSFEFFDLPKMISAVLQEVSPLIVMESVLILTIGCHLYSSSKRNRLKRAGILFETEELEELLKMKQKRLRFLKEKTYSCDKDLKGVSLSAKQQEFSSSIESRTSRLAELERAKRALYDLGLVQEEPIGQVEPAETTKTILLDPKKDII